MGWLLAGLLLADVLVAPGALQDLPPELKYLEYAEYFRPLGTLPCRDAAGNRSGICRVLIEPETRDHYFLMYRDERLWKAWRVNGADRRPQVLWQAPPRCGKEDECA